MATIATRGTVRQELGLVMAMRVAWWTWLGLLLTPFILFLVVAYRITDESAVAHPDVARAWFVGTMAYLCVMAPVSFFWRSHKFKAYWQGEVVAPKDYLMGQVPVWLVLEVGGILSLIGCLVSNTFVPCVLPAVAAFMFFLPLWPSGVAMVRRNVGNVDDPARYQEPR